MKHPRRLTLRDRIAASTAALVILFLSGCFAPTGGKAADLPRFFPVEPFHVEPALAGDVELFVDCARVRAATPAEQPRFLSVRADLISPDGRIVEGDGYYEITLHQADFDRPDRLGVPIASYRVPRAAGASESRGRPESSRFLLELPANLPDDPTVDKGCRAALFVKFVGEDGLEVSARSGLTRVP